MVKKLKLKKKVKTYHPSWTGGVEGVPIQENSPIPENPQPEPQSPEASLEPSSTSSPTDEPPTHFDDLIGGATVQPIEGATAQEAVKLGRDDFHKLFMMGFKVGHSLTKLQSLNVPPEDTAARDCAHALYDSVIDIPALHFLLEPQNKWFERVIVIGTFTVPMAISVKAEIAERRRLLSGVSATAMNTATRAPAGEGDPSPDLAASLGAA